ncbi:MAG: Smr/MutS family protein [Cyclobacteriaceae bacterium]|nr:Smr/MutS family protein [Cyclobacteriaceae bacterium]UYN87992.1 MAG: Smr/MutS family protein [Cyclobacteriaceae bacterium]
MPHPNDVENRLGFDHIRARLINFTLSALGKAHVDALYFLTDADAIKHLLQQVNEFKQVFERGDAFPSNHYLDPAALFKRASLEGNYLDEQDFLHIAHSLQTILACRDYLVKNREQYPVLFQLAGPIQVSGAFVKQIHAVIDDARLVRDSASTELSRIRRRLRDEQGRSRKLIDQVYRHAVEQQWVPEGALPTIRGGRLVIPVLAEHKRKLKGFIQDESATGQTVFMEPAEVLEANNEIRDLEHAEKREVIRILIQLTDNLRKEIPQLQLAYQFLGWIDFIRAKAKLAVELQAELPEIAPTPTLRWMNARHPLLFMSLKGKRELVPLTIDLTEADRFLLVSGPNAGGKSVCLKTVGLLQYMLQCGLLIPVSPDSKAGIFDDLFIDIGDQQSIENDLSTYSSHLKNMAHFVQHGHGKTLVLLDELGSGTDPNFGGAIAQAILQALLKKRVWGVATTHYYNLKLFAGQQQGIRNAAMRFDEKNMVPLYLLDIGKPGSSFALEIAHKTGLPEEILETARQLAGSELVGFETLVRDLEQERNMLTEKSNQLRKQDITLKALLKKYEVLSSELDAKKKEILNKAKEEASRLLAETNREIEKTIRHIRENQAQKQETTKVRKNLEVMAQKVSRQEVQKPKPPVVLKPGDRVRITGQDGSGVVLSVKGKQAMVQFGELKSMVALSQLELASQSKADKVTEAKLRSVGLSLHEKRAVYSSVLDVRGKRVDEVVPLLDQFIDTSVLLSQGEIKILHGKGEGVLRKVIREQLKKYKQVASVADEHVERGGDGITVVVLK